MDQLLAALRVGWDQAALLSDSARAPAWIIDARLAVLKESPADIELLIALASGTVCTFRPPHLPFSFQLT